MTLLAGYDMVTQIGARSLASLFRNNLRLDDQDALSPFQIERPFDMSGIPGTLTLIVHAVSVDLRTGAPIVLELGFHHTVVTAGPMRICPLDGTITIAMQPTMTTQHDDDRDADIAVMSLAMRDAVVGMRLSDDAEAILANEIAGLPLTADQFRATALQFLADFVHDQPDFSFSLGFRITGDTRGWITPDIAYSALEVHCVGGDDRATQSLALAGYIFPGNRNNGRPAEIDPNTYANSQLAVALSPEVFRTFIFCPGIAQSFQSRLRSELRSYFTDKGIDLPVDPAAGITVTVADLPTACGDASEFKIDGAKLTKIEDSFHDGYIGVDIGFKVSRPYGTAEGTASNKMTLHMVNGRIESELEAGTPDVDFDLLAWVYLLGAGLELGGIGLVRLGEAIGEGIADGIAADKLGDALNGTQSSTALTSGLGDITAGFHGVYVKAGGLLITGVGTVLRRPGGDPDIRLAQVGVNVASELREEGVWETKIFCEPRPDKFPYKFYLQTQTVTLQPNVILGPPLQTTYRLTAAGGKVAPLTGTSGKVTIPGVMVQTLMPLGSGGMQFYRDVEIAYVISGNEVKLTNRPEDGNFVVTLVCEYRDCAGRKIAGFEGHSSSTIQFEGQRVEIGNDYDARVGACIISKGRQVQQIADKIRQQLGAVRKPIDLVDPGPDDVRILVESMMRAGLPEAAQAVANLRVSRLSKVVTQALEGPLSARAVAPAAVNTEPDALATQLETMARALRTRGGMR